MLQISEPKPAEAGAAYYLSCLRDPARLSFWHGKGAVQLTVAPISLEKAEVKHHEFRSLLNCICPLSKSNLMGDAGDQRGSAFSVLTFGVPNQVSSAYDAATRNVRAEMDHALGDALTKTLSLAEKRLGLGWGGADGGERVPANLTFAVFRSFNDQAIQPQLRWHCLLMNLGVRPDGTITTLVTKPLFDAKIALGSFFRHEARRELGERFGFKAVYGVYPSIPDGAPWELSAARSERRLHLSDFLKSRGELFVSLGLNLAKASDLAAVAERAPQNRLVQDELFEKWRDQAVAAGWSVEQVDKRLGATFAKGSENGLAEAVPKTGALVTRLKESISFAAANPFADLSHYTISYDDWLKAEVRKTAMRKNLTLIRPDKHAESGHRQSHEPDGEQRLSPQSPGTGLLAKLSALAHKLMPHRKEAVSEHDHTDKRKEKDKTLHP